MFRSLLNLFYPNLCASCKEVLLKNEKTICVNCLIDMPRNLDFKDADNPVAKMFWGKVKLEHAFSSFSFVKNGKIQTLMHELKYKGNTDVGEILGVEVGKDIKRIECLSDIDFIVPVPLHKKRLLQRGYNQSEFIAIGIAKVIDSLVDTSVLKRSNNSASQTKKSKYERWENVGDIFEITDKNKFEGKHLLLVDDVVTTGATLEACCKKLEEVDGLRISIVTLASA